MANLHFRQLQSPLRSERHLSTIKATLHQFKHVLEEADERQSVFTNVYQALWETLHTDFEGLDQPANKKAKTSSDESELLRIIQASLLSLITSARNDVTAFASKKEPHEPDMTAPSVLEVYIPKATSCTPIERRAVPTTSECGMETCFQTWEKALKLCNAAIKSETSDIQETQYYEPDDVGDLSQDFSNLSFHDQELFIPTNREEATRVLSEFRPSQNIPATLQGILAAKADPNIIIGAGGITPLHNVIAFARKVHVCDMRRLLLEAGAMESDAMKERWSLRCRADASDAAWVANFHQEPTLVPSISSESQ